MYYVRGDFGSHHNQNLYYSTIANHKTNKTLTTTPLDISKRAGRSPQHHWKYQSQQDIHHSIVVNHKTSRTFTIAALGISKWAGRTPPHHCNLQNKRVLTRAPFEISKGAGRAQRHYCKFQSARHGHHSTTVDHKTSRMYNRAPLFVFHEEEVYHSNSGHFKESMTFTTAPLQILERTGRSSQHRCST